MKPTDSDLWDMFAPSADPQGISELPISVIAQQIGELRRSAARRFEPDLIELCHMDIAWAIKAHALEMLAEINKGEQ